MTQQDPGPPVDAVIIPWRAPVWPLIAAFAFVTGLDLLNSGIRWDDADQTTTAAIGGILTIIAIGGGWKRSSARHRIAQAIGYVLLSVLPFAVIDLLPTAQRHEWSAVRPASMVGATIAVYAYVAITRRPGFAPPIRESDDDRWPRAKRLYPVPSQLWTAEERAERLGASGVRVYPIVFNALVFVFLTLIAIGVAVVEWSLHGPAVGVLAILVALLTAGAAGRAFRIAVIIDADGLTVRAVLLDGPAAQLAALVGPSRSGYTTVAI